MIWYSTDWCLKKYQNLFCCSYFEGMSYKRHCSTLLKSILINSSITSFYNGYCCKYLLFFSRLCCFCQYFVIVHTQGKILWSKFEWRVWVHYPLRWPNTVFTRAFGDVIQSAYKDWKNKHAVNRSISLFTQHLHFNLHYFSLLLNAVYWWLKSFLTKIR